jgi:LuxR family maltose regulon positive regulatory protein
VWHDFQMTDDRQGFPEMRRSRLGRRYRHLLPERFVLVRAPAGYGKSVLLRQWLEEARELGQPVALLGVGEGIASADALYRKLHEAACHAGAARAASLFMARLTPAALAPQAQPPAVAAAPTRPEPLLLLIDDVHGLLPAPVRAALQELLVACGDAVQWVLAVRDRTVLSVGRLFAQGMRELGPDDLRFSAAETLELIEAAGLHDESRALVTEHIARTEGWPAGVRMLITSCMDHDGKPREPDWSVDFTDRVHSYFFDTILDKAPEELQAFLVQTSILSILEGPACEAITGRSDSAQLLRAAEENGLFISRADSHSRQFRCHAMLADALGEHLRRHFPSLARPLHLKAASHFRAEGQHRLAIEHLLGAGDLESATSQLDDWCAIDYESCGQDAYLLAIRLPHRLVATRPHLMLTLVDVFAFRWDFDHALATLGECRQLIDSLAPVAAVDSGRLPELEHRYMHCQMWIALFQNDMPRAASLGRALIEQWATAPPLLRANLFITVIRAATDSYSLAEIESTAERARRLLELSTHRLPQVPLVCALARARILAGRQGESIAPLREQLAVASHDVGSIGAIGSGLLAIPLAQICHERNEITEAEQLLDRHLPPRPGFTFLEDWISGRIVQARLRLARGDVPGAIKALALDVAWVPEGGLERIRQIFGSEQIAVLIEAGHVDEAAAIARQLHLPAHGAQLVPTAQAASSLLEARSRAFVRLAAAQGRHADALRLAARWRAFVAERGATRSVVQWDVLMASVLVGQNRIQLAQRHLRAAISLAAPGQYLRSILDGGRQLGTLLLDNPSLGASLSGDGDAFCALLVSAFERELGRNASGLARPTLDTLPPNLLSTLNSRERELLQLIASGLTNRQVAERIAISEGTVKWYLHHLYSKLGVNRRTLAVMRARELGIA